MLLAFRRIDHSSYEIVATLGAGIGDFDDRRIDPVGPDW